MKRRTDALLGLALVLGLATCVWPGPLLLRQRDDPAKTPCPPATTPERAMPREAAQVEAAIGQPEVTVSAFGLSHCPGEPAATIALVEITAQVDDLADRDALGALAEQILPALRPWPESTLVLRFEAMDDVLDLRFATRPALAAYDRGARGRALLQALVELDR